MLKTIQYTAQKNGPPSEGDDLSYHTGFTSKYTNYNPKQVAILALTATMKVVGQLRNLRAGHESQGLLKKVNLNATTEDYSNYMARLRLNKIKKDVEREIAKAKSSGKSTDDLRKIFHEDVTRPETHTFLTPEWDEMIPFPSSKDTIYATHNFVY
jgi:hypothetical protein